MKNQCVGKNTGGAAGCRLIYPVADLLSRGNALVLPAQLRRKVGALHNALREAIPVLRGEAPLSSSVMDEAFHLALQQTQPEAFKALYLEANLLKRYVGADLSDSAARVEAAVDALVSSEVKCRSLMRSSRGVCADPTHISPSTLSRCFLELVGLLGLSLVGLTWRCSRGPAALRLVRRRSSLESRRNFITSGTEHPTCQCVHCLTRTRSLSGQISTPLKEISLSRSTTACSLFQRTSNAIVQLVNR